MKLKPLPERRLSLLHLGDSYTIGEGVAMNQSWPAQLKQMLKSKGRQIDNSKVVARTGWTTGHLLTALAKETIDTKWDLVTLCIGVNNQYRNLDEIEFQQDLVKLLRRAHSYVVPADGQVVLLSIPDWSGSPFAADRDTTAIRAEIDLFNEACYHTADSMDTAYIEWTSLTRRLAGVASAFAEDGLHPSASQYREWATFLLQHLIPGQ